MWFGNFNPNINFKIGLFIFDKLKTAGQFWVAEQNP
jgi:hypothetical protein